MLTNKGESLLTNHLDTWVDKEHLDLLIWLFIKIVHVQWMENKIPVLLSVFLD